MVEAIPRREGICTLGGRKEQHALASLELREKVGELVIVHWRAAAAMPYPHRARMETLQPTNRIRTAHKHS